MKSIADPRLNLLTVLNVQSAKPSKRTAPASRDWHALARKAAKRSNAPTASTTTGRLRAELAEQIVTAADHELKGPAAKKGKGSAESSSASAGAKTSADQAQDEQNESVADSDDEGETAGTTQDPFIRHFGAESTLVHGHEAEALAGDRANWAKERRSYQRSAKCCGLVRGIQQWKAPGRLKRRLRKRSCVQIFQSWSARIQH